MSAQHTPGPWTSYTGTNSIWADGKRAICIVTGARNHEDQERDANARLIAAAPDLLEALNGVLPYMEAAETEGLVGDEGCHWPVENVRAAIAKATGSAS
jgi:hypothetical protein